MDSGRDIPKASKKARPAWRRYLLLAAGLAAGLLLIAFGSSGGKKTDSAVSDAAEINAYAAALEEKARALCESASGVGRGSVTVTITLDGGFDAVYAEDSEKKTSGTGESVTGKYATVGGGSSEAPIRIGVRTPRIAGIGVVCRG